MLRPNIISGYLGVLRPNIISSEWSTATEYLTDNPKLIEKYGEGYTFEQGKFGQVAGEANWRGYSGHALLNYVVNGEDTYDVFLSIKKGKPWVVDSIIATYPTYRCREIPLSFCIEDINVEEPNGLYTMDGKEIGVTVRLGLSNIIAVDITSQKVAYSYIENGEPVYVMDYDYERIFVANCTFDLDTFTAVLTKEYTGVLGKDVNKLTFYTDDSMPRAKQAE